MALGQHDGLSPLGQTAEDRDKVAGGALRALGRLGAGKDVPQRRKLIASALAGISDADSYWIEALASGLASETGVGAAEAQVAALAGAWEVRDGEIARMVRSVNMEGSDAFSGHVVRGLLSAAPEFGKRMMAGKIDSDEVMLRVAMAHLFRRDATSPMQLFVIDAAVKLLPKGLKMSVGAFTRSCLERFDDEPAPVEAWGYVVILREMTGRAGYYLQEPTEATRAQVAQMKAGMRDMLGDVPEDQMRSHLMAGAISGHLFQRRVGEFASIMAVVFEEIGMRHGVVYAREDEGGVLTDLSEIPAASVDEARRVVGKLPQVSMHDDFRAMTEMLSQMRDAEDIEKQS